MRESIEVFDCAQDIVVGDPLVIAPRFHRGADEERHDSVILLRIIIIFIPRHNQQTVVLLGPLNIGKV